MGIVFQSILLDIGVLTAVILLIIYIRFKKAFSYWKKKNVPYIEPIFPFGNFMDAALVRRSFADMNKNQYKSLDGHDFGGFYIFTKPAIMFRDPDLIKTVLVKDFSSFHDRGIYINEEVEPLTGQLFMLPGTRWRNLRVKLSPTFTSGKMKMMFQTLVDCGIELQDLVENMANETKVMEIKDILARYSTDVISSCAFGIQCNSLKNPDAEFRQWGRKFFNFKLKQVIVGLLSVVAPSVLDFFKVSTLDKEVSKYFRTMVKETIEYREKNNVGRNDFLQLLIQLKNKGYVAPDNENETSSEEPAEINYLPMDSLAAQAFVFFAAGFETSSTTMTFCLYELAVNPDIQERVRKEILKVIDKYNGKITYECILEMSYLDQVVSETLRKYPPVPILNRECTNEYTIPGTDIVIEKGTPTVIPIISLQHDPKHYPNPEKFDPDRFTQEEIQKRHPYVYIPFGEGPRICIGMRFGLMQTKVGLVSLLSKFNIEVSEKTSIPLVMNKMSFILAPKGGMWLKITKRS